ncbi:diguanylate cyclase domain-containing protein, partial [Salmonella sp. NW1213]|uniref:diguanylate cyclase domain-containing protein n=1 Tax=Salmonella sp. NW1213 TaxID=2947653 RepID=UPI003F485003
ADRNRSHWSTSKTPSYTKSVSWQHHPIRKSDYAIRLGGDEFCIILVDYAADLAIHLPERIIRNLQIIAPDKTVHFSAGIYNMQPNDTINDAYQASDAQLYLNKQQKQHRSS